MKLFKRAFGSLGLIALVTVSGVALADEGDDVQDSVAVVAESAEEGNQNLDVLDDGAVSDGNIENDNSSDNSSDTLDASDITDADKCDKSGSPVENMTIVIQNDGEGVEVISALDVLDDGINQGDMLKDFEEAGEVSYSVEFVELFKEFEKYSDNFSQFHGEHKVLVELYFSTGPVVYMEDGK
ncbi:MAG: hypothetical protein IKZ87_01930, partial [Actinomycetaceae bacterium]|nr:hypothetical protein [Actinomycetaceae bacterium]